MKSKLLSELESVLPGGMYVPKEIKTLYNWIEENQLYVETNSGFRIGFLFPEKELKESWTDDGRDGRNKN